MDYTWIPDYHLKHINIFSSAEAKGRGYPETLPPQVAKLVGHWGSPGRQADSWLSAISAMNIVIELDDGKIYRKPLYLMVKTMVSCRFSLKSIHWYSQWMRIQFMDTTGWYATTNHLPWSSYMVWLSSAWDDPKIPEVLMALSLPISVFFNKYTYIYI